MPAHRPLRKGLALLRPFLALPRAAIDAYAAARGLAWVDDESNANTGVKRNFIRHDVAPRLAAAFPGYPVTLVRAAAHQAEAARLIDELAALDAQGAVADDPVAGATLDRTALIVLAARAPHRARNLLRWFLRQHQLAAPSAARLAAMLDQLSGAAPHARVRLVHAGVEVGFHRGRIVVHAPALAFRSRGPARRDWLPSRRTGIRVLHRPGGRAPGWTGSMSRFGPGPGERIRSPMIVRAGR
jgi:tRNA(Ile)-lysidine synthase